MFFFKIYKKSQLLWRKKRKPRQDDIATAFVLLSSVEKLLPFLLSGVFLDEAALLDASLLTGESTQIIKLSATNAAILVDNDAVDEG